MKCSHKPYIRNIKFPDGLWALQENACLSSVSPEIAYIKLSKTLRERKF